MLLEHHLKDVKLLSFLREYGKMSTNEAPGAVPGAFVFLGI